MVYITGIIKDNSYIFKRELEKLRPNVMPRVIWSDNFSSQTTANGTNGKKCVEYI